MNQDINRGVNGVALDDPCILVAAIDFGTTFTRYAYSFKANKDDIKVNKKWGAELGFDCQNGIQNDIHENMCGGVVTKQKAHNCTFVMVFVLNVLGWIGYN